MSSTFWILLVCETARALSTCATVIFIACAGFYLAMADRDAPHRYSSNEEEKRAERAIVDAHIANVRRFLIYVAASLLMWALIPSRDLLTRTYVTAEAHQLVESRALSGALTSIEDVLSGLAKKLKDEGAK